MICEITSHRMFAKESSPVSRPALDGYNTAKLLPVDEDKDLGRVFEVEYDRVAAKGKLRFPRFVCWRPDKPKEECRYKRSEL